MMAVEVDLLSKSFGGLRAVDAVSLAVPAGQRRILIGPNGAGKTTLFHCIAGTLEPSAGRVLLFATDITHLPENRRTARGMGRTFQISNVLTELTAFENLALAIMGTGRRKWTMHRRLGAFGEIRAKAMAGLATVGLDRRADEAVMHLSYGERRQLELALALGSDPRVLLLDEPCAGLSPSERQRLFQTVAGLSRDITVIVIEHDIDIALALADHVTVLHRGKVILDGTPAAVQSFSPSSFLPSLFFFLLFSFLSTPFHLNNLTIPIPSQILN
ncbi:MAG: ABC transporter ATP-binding protein [Xanthobacteraceae bacterium]|nr:ABC transporter ATP-binding protein [Xanthobacteraceae bacterium]